MSFIKAKRVFCSSYNKFDNNLWSFRIDAVKTNKRLHSRSINYDFTKQVITKTVGMSELTSKRNSNQQSDLQKQTKSQNLQSISDHDIRGHSDEDEKFEKYHTGVLAESLEESAPKFSQKTNTSSKLETPMIRFQSSKQLYDNFQFSNIARLSSEYQKGSSPRRKHHKDLKNHLEFTRLKRLSSEDNTHYISPLKAVSLTQSEIKPKISKDSNKDELLSVIKQLQIQLQEKESSWNTLESEVLTLKSENNELRNTINKLLVFGLQYGSE